MNLPGKINAALTRQEVMKKSTSGWLIVLVLALLAAGAYLWWHNRALPPPEVVEVAAPAAVASGAVEQAPPATPVPVEPAIKYPVEAIDPAPAASPALPALAEANSFVTDALTNLLGRKQVLTFLQLDGFVRRTVATVDNLSRQHAPPLMWPVNPTPGKFTTLAGEGNYTAGETAISPDNGLRYTPFVLFVEAINTAQAVKLYARLYPLFQQAYVELGYPKGYFNDRLVAVIDHLLAAPVPTEPLKVSLTEVRGPLKPVRPWVTYEFTDPALNALSAGQKILLRMGPVNERRMKAKLADIRRLVVGAALAKPAEPAPR